MFQRFGLGFNFPINEGLKYIKMTKLINKKINYLKQYETRDFNSKFTNYKNYKNYYLTPEFKKYKPNLKN